MQSLGMSQFISAVPAWRELTVLPHRDLSQDIEKPRSADSSRQKQIDMLAARA
jgi:hypothetical protein